MHRSDDNFLLTKHFSYLTGVLNSLIMQVNKKTSLSKSKNNIINSTSPMVIFFFSDNEVEFPAICRTSAKPADEKMQKESNVLL